MLSVETAWRSLTWAVRSIAGCEREKRRPNRPNAVLAFPPTVEAMIPRMGGSPPCMPANSPEISRNSDVASLSSSYLDLRSKLGDAIVKPGQDATPEEIAKFHQSMGAPAEAAGYGLKHDKFENLPLREGMVTGLMDWGHKNGVSVENMNSLFDLSYPVQIY